MFSRKISLKSFGFASLLIFGFLFFVSLFVYGILVGFQWSGGTRVHEWVFGYVMGEKLEQRGQGNEDGS